MKDRISVKIINLADRFDRKDEWRTSDSDIDGV